jgi:hypothetical protein
MKPMHATFFLAILAATACGTVEPVDSVPVIDTNLAPIVSEFIDSCREHGILADCMHRLFSIKTIKVADTPENIGGYCWFDKETLLPNHIQVSSTIPAKLIRTVLFHELGHGILAKGHTETGSPDVIMRPQMPSEEPADWKAAKDALFTVPANREGFHSDIESLIR